MGISASAYSDAGYNTCAGYPGSYGHEAQDLETWTEWYVLLLDILPPFTTIFARLLDARWDNMIRRSFLMTVQGIRLPKIRQLLHSLR